MDKEELIQTDHFETMEELISTIKLWKIDDDYDAYCRFFDIRCAFELVNKIEKQQKEIEKLRIKNGKEFARGMETNEKLWQAKIEDKIETIRNDTWFIDGCDAQLACIDELMSL